MYRKEIIMTYNKDQTYIVADTKPVDVLTKASDDGLLVTTCSPGSGVHCLTFTHDDNNDIWIRISIGWIRATRGNEIYIR